MMPRNIDKEAKDECTLDIDHDNKKLKPTANLSILGVNIDDQLSFTEHISDICSEWETSTRSTKSPVVFYFLLTSLLQNPYADTNNVHMIKAKKCKT